MEMPTPFTLPTIDIIAGSYCTLTFNTFADNKLNPYDLTGCTARFYFKPYLYEGVDLSKSKNMTLASGSNYLTVNLMEHDTRDMKGKYIYQISITD